MLEKYNAKYAFNSKDTPKCKCDGIIKPDVVLYGETLTQNYDYVFKNILKEKTLIVAGTSLTIEPAYGSIQYFKGKGFIINNKISF